MNSQDIRWEQRFSNFQKALSKLTQAITYIKNNINDNSDLKNSDEIHDEIIKEGLIQRFEYTYEMAWNVMKDYAIYQGVTEIAGSRDAIRYAFSANLISNGDLWMEMIKSRIKTSHTYNEETANEIYLKITNEYFDEFFEFQEIMKGRKSK